MHHNDHHQQNGNKTSGSMRHAQQSNNPINVKADIDADGQSSSSAQNILTGKQHFCRCVYSISDDGLTITLEKIMINFSIFIICLLCCCSGQQF